MIHVPAANLKQFCLQALTHHNVRPDVARHVAKGLVQASLRGVDSHGVRLLPHYLRAVTSGRLNPNPTYRFERTAAAAGRLDGDHTFGHAAGAEGMSHAIKLAREAGVGTVAVYNSSHFGAAAYFALMAAEQDMIGLSFSHADALMVSYGGKRPFFGPNPICFAAPCRDEEPFCLDMATSLVTWNKILQVRDSGGRIPAGWGVDDQGKDTVDVNKVAALHPIGGYKGYGLSMMIDVLCSLLTGMNFGPHILRMYADPIEQKRFLGHLFMVLRIDSFATKDEFKARMQQMMDEVRAEPAADPGQPVMVAGDPEKQVAEQRTRTGIPVPDHLWSQFRALVSEFDLSLDFADV